MANKKHLELLKNGVDAWNDWRMRNPDELPDLEGAELAGIDLGGTAKAIVEQYIAGFTEDNIRNLDLLDCASYYPFAARGATLENKMNYFALATALTRGGANLVSAKLSGANLSEACLLGAQLFNSELENTSFTSANLVGAMLDDSSLCHAELKRANCEFASFAGARIIDSDLSEATLVKSNFLWANLNGSNLEYANLCGANLTQASLVETNLSGATLDGCSVYGSSIWDVNLDKTSQRNLIITKENQSTITVDDLRVAQFVYLLLNNEVIRSVINTITSKAVLILGRFTHERLLLLEAMRDELRKLDYLPILFNFEKPSNRDLTETISTLAHLARFIIADITDASAVPQELQKIVPSLPSVPVQTLILESQYAYEMFKDIGGYLSVLPPYRYQNTDELLKSLEEKLINPALTRAQEIVERRQAFEDNINPL